jgi:ABC-type proline/glycine betaine transport system ATPase subunit
MVTHNLSEGLKLATRVAIQVAGRFAWTAQKSELDETDFDRHYHRVVEGAA